MIHISYGFQRHTSIESYDRMAELYDIFERIIKTGRIWNRYKTRKNPDDANYDKT